MATIVPAQPGSGARSPAKCAGCGGSIVAEADGTGTCLSCGEIADAAPRGAPVRPGPTNDRERLVEILQ